MINCRPLQKIKNDEGHVGAVSALFVYPTKALSRDQFPKILKFVNFKIR